MNFTLVRYSLNFCWQNIKILLNPNDLTPIWKMRLHPSWTLARQYLDFIETQPGLKEGLQLRPNGSKFYTSNVFKKKYPPGSLGDEYQLFLYRYRVGSNFYPDSIEIRDEIDYFNSHIIAIHDLWHVTMGFESSLLGEIKLSAFSMAQFRSPMHTGFVLLALMTGVFKKGEYIPHIMEAITSGWRMGVSCKNIMLIEWENWLDKPIADLRREIGMDYML